MALKRNGSAVENGAAEQNGESNGSFEFRENPRINGQIDGYIKANPKRWEFVKSMSRERLERAYVWQQIRSNERQQKMNGGMFRKIEDNPALKDAYDNLIQQIPEGQRERAKVSIARTLVLSQSRGQKQGAGVAA